MATKYWIKLYHEILDDPKMGRLPPNLWRRFIECCLLAGELNYDDDDPQNGRLPPTADMSWRLRVDEETLAQELDALARRGLVEHRADEVLSGYWFVTAFNKRQRKMSKAEYMRRLRKERVSVTPELAKRYQPVTNGNADIDTDKDKDMYTHARAFAHPLPEPVAELITALSATCKDGYGPGINEERYEQAAYALVGWDITADEVSRFGEWWRTNGHYSGMPALKSLLAEIRNARDPNYQKRAAANNNKHNDLQRLTAAITRHGKRGVQAARAELDGLWATVDRMGGWHALCEMRADDVQYKYYAAVKETAA